MSWLWVASDAGLFCSDCQGKWAVHLQRCNGSSAYGRLALEQDASPAKMVRPAILPRIEYRCWLAGLRILEELPGSFMQRARDASESQIVGIRRATGRNWNNMIDMKRGDLSKL